MSEYIDYTNLMLQPSKIIHTKVEILNMKDEVVGELDDYCIDVSVSVDVSTLARRTMTATFKATTRTEINELSLLWINKRIKLYFGIEKYSGEIVWFNMGIFIINNPTTEVGLEQRNISITGTDKMFLFQRPFMNIHTINADTPVHAAIKGLSQLISETKLLIEDSEYQIPMEIQVSPEDIIEDTLKEITNLYMNYQVYYNLDGYLVFEKTKNKINDPIMWEFIDGKNLTISRNIVSDYDSIKNHIKVLGAYDEKTALQPKYEIMITDDTNMFSINNIGERNQCFIEDKYTTEEQCKLKCEYEMEQVQNLSKTFTIETAPIFMLNDVNKLIKVKDNDIIYTCVIDKINLNPISAMTIECHQIFDN